MDLLDLRTVLTAKLLMVANLNAKPAAEGPRVDSDADGLTDAEEELLGTLVGTADSDGDGIGDRVEVFAGLNPAVPDMPSACEGVNPAADTDLDGLSDCDEKLLGTDPTLVDTDGDGLPDRMEVLLQTDYLNRDAEADSDGDGVNNGDEILQHSDPRSTDTRAHLSFGYRYEIEDEGFLRELFATNPKKITGVGILELSEGTTPGVGTMRYNPLDRSLSWQDANDDKPGRSVVVGQGGEFWLPSGSYAEIQGSTGKRIKVEISAVDLGPEQQTEPIRVIFRDRQCLSYSIRNVQLVETQELDDGTVAGTNKLLMYFAQSPEERITVPGPFRMAQIPVIFRPPDQRSPDEAIIGVRNDEFVRANLGAP
jgi:hypothetical protein